MANPLVRNAFSAAGQTIAQTLVLVFLYRYLLNTIGVEKLGVWSIVMATASAARLSEMGLAGSVTKFVAAYRAQGNEQAATESLHSAAISLGFVLAIVLPLAYHGLLWALPYVLPASGLADGRAILPYALASLWLTSVAGIWMSGLDACLRSDLRAGIMVVGTIAFLLMSFAGVTYYGLVGLAVAQVAQGVFLVILGWVLVRRVMQSKALLPVQWSTARFREMLGYGVNFQINSFVMLLFEPMTKILLGRYGELAAAGYFEMAQRLVMKVRALIVESNRVIVPVFAGMAQGDGGAKRLYISNVRYLFFLITPIFAGLLALIPAISELWIGSYERQFIIMTIYATAAWYINSITAPAYFAYLGQGKLRWITMAHIVMGIVNLLGGLVLGDYFGWHGVITAFAVALVIGSVIPLFAYHREQRISVMQILDSRDLLLAIVCFISAVFALECYWLMYSVGGSQWLRIVLVATSVSVVILTAAWLHPLCREIIALTRARLIMKRQEMNEG